MSDYDVTDLISDIVVHLKLTTLLRLSLTSRRNGNLIYRSSSLIKPHIEDLSKFRHLLYLDLSDYSTRIYNISQLTTLKILNLSGNNTVTKIDKLTNLTDLSLKNNHCISDIRNLTNLTKLNLYGQGPLSFEGRM